jgi:hypothetical protein
MGDIDRLIAAARRAEAHSVVSIALELLAAAARDPGLLPLNAHPVGFAHAKLGDFDGCTVRLHIWPTPPIAPQDPPWLVHRHAWALTSYVVKGSVSNELFSVSASQGGDHLLYEVGYNDGESVMTATSMRVRCTLSSSEQITEGNRYTVPPDAFHCTVAVGTEPTATIAVTGKPSGPPPLVVGTPAPNLEYRFRRRVINKKAAQAIFASVCA